MASRDFQAPGIARIQRATELAGRYPSAGEVLEFYARLVTFQIEILPRAKEYVSLPSLVDDLVEFVREHGTDTLKEAAGELDAHRLELAITDYLNRNDTTSPTSFFARVVLQPFVTVGELKSVATGENLCPNCGQLPQVAVLRPRGHGNAISLVCSLCMDEWDFRRGSCPGCCENDLKQLEFYSAAELDYIQVQVCRSCNGYIHCIDTIKESGTIPFVDELAALPLDIWGREKGFEKIQPNLAGI